MSPETGVGCAPVKHPDADLLRATIEEFLARSRRAVLLEPGTDQILLNAESFAIECRNRRLTIQAWDDHHNIARRVVDVRRVHAGRLELIVERFGKRTGRLLLVDQAKPRNHAVSQLERRAAFREQFRRFLCRQFPGWTIRRLSGDADLAHSLSPVYPRALVHRGGSGWAALGAPMDDGDAAGALAFGLIWLDYLRRSEQRITIGGLTLLLPEGSQNTTCLRLRYLDSRLVRSLVFVYSRDGREQSIDPNDYGNLETHLEVCGNRRRPEGAEDRILRELGRLGGVELIPDHDGGLSCRVRGVVFARFSAGKLMFGLGRKRRARAADLGEILAMAAELVRLRSPEAADRGNALFTRNPEGWLESQVRSNLEVVDPSLVPSPVYGQVPAFAAGARGVLDLLAVDHRGRLAVVELKASTDLQLPLQALNYWMRVRWHAETGEFERRGYFPGQPLSREAPRLLLVAPSLEFHPTTETILRYFQPGIPVERIGVNMGWRRQLRVVFRFQGARKPGL